MLDESAQQGPRDMGVNAARDMDWGSTSGREWRVPLIGEGTARHGEANSWN